MSGQDQDWNTEALHLHFNKCKNTQSARCPDVCGVRAAKVNTGRRSFMFISQPVVSLYRPLHIYSTLLHWEYSRCCGRKFVAQICNVHLVVGGINKHKQTSLEFILNRTSTMSSKGSRGHSPVRLPCSYLQQGGKWTRVQFKRTKNCRCENILTNHPIYQLNLKWTQSQINILYFSVTM